MKAAMKFKAEFLFRDSNAQLQTEWREFEATSAAAAKKAASVFAKTNGWRLFQIINTPT